MSEGPGADGFAVPAGRRSLPRGNAALPPDVVALSQRLRLTRAVVEVMAEQGYPDTTVSAVIKRAGVSRTTFYALFPDKQACALAAYELAAQVQQAQRRQAADRVEEPRAKLRAVAQENVALLAVPQYARLMLLDVLALGPPGWDRYEQDLARRAQLLADLSQALPQAATRSLVRCTAAAAGVDQLLRQHLRHGGAQELEQLERDCAAVLFASLGLAMDEPDERNIDALPEQAQRAPAQQ